MARVRRHFRAECKQEAVRLVTPRGVAQAHAARDWGIPVPLLRAWGQAAARPGAAVEPNTAQRLVAQAELAHLRQEVATWRMARDLRKKAAASVAKESR